MKMIFCIYYLSVPSSLSIVYYTRIHCKLNRTNKEQLILHFICNIIVRKTFYGVVFDVSFLFKESLYRNYMNFFFAYINLPLTSLPISLVYSGMITLAYLSSIMRAYGINNTLPTLFQEKRKLNIITE